MLIGAGREPRPKACLPPRRGARIRESRAQDACALRQTMAAYQANGPAQAMVLHIDAH